MEGVVGKSADRRRWVEGGENEAMVSGKGERSEKDRAPP